MGIRYYGWAISSDEVTEAGDDPWTVIRRADQRHDAAGWTNTYFDKAWSRLQNLFAQEWPQTRPGYDLVAGNVTYPDGSFAYEPHIGIVDSTRMPAIASDVASITRGDIRLMCDGLRFTDAAERSQEIQYVAHYLAEAQEFSADAAARGHGVIYVIR